MLIPTLPILSVQYITNNIQSDIIIMKQSFQSKVTNLNIITSSLLLLINLTRQGNSLDSSCTNVR